MTILTLFLGVSACSSTPERATAVSLVEREITAPPAPAPLNLESIEWQVITALNIDEFVARQGGRKDFVVYALSPSDYETLVLNLADLRRFVLQQGGIITYYEAAIVPINNSEENSGE